MWRTTGAKDNYDEKRKKRKPVSKYFSLKNRCLIQNLTLSRFSEKQPFL